MKTCYNLHPRLKPLLSVVFLSLFIILISKYSVIPSLARSIYNSSNISSPQVLGDTTTTPFQGGYHSSQDLSFNIKIPANFLSDVNFEKSINILGNLTAPNVLYSLTGGKGINITSGQNPTISNTGVLSLQGKSGALTLEAGDGIDIDGLKISNTYAFTPDYTQSGWTKSGSMLFLSNLTDKVGIGTSNPQSALDVNGDLNVSGNIIGKLNLSGSATISGDLNLSGSTNINGDLNINTANRAEATYSVSSAEFNPITLDQENPIVFLNSFFTSQTSVPLPFNFNYFGINHNSIQVFTSGYVGFDNSTNIYTPGSLPNSVPSNNAIYGNWNTLYPSGGSNGSVTYGISGTTPNRIFVINYKAVKNFYGNPTTFQVKLFETSNNIEIHCQSCTNTRAATQGIENPSGTVAYYMPGRNNSIFSLTNDAIRFTYIPGNITGYSSTLLVNPDGNVGIGTSTPAYKLDVVGTGHLTNLLTDNLTTTNLNTSGGIANFTNSDSLLNLNKIYSANSSPSWSTGAAGGTARSFSTSTLYNGKIYSWAGFSNTITNALDIYDIATNTWSTGTPGGKSRGDHTSVLYNGKIYSWGGVDSNYNSINTLDIYDIATNSWSTGASCGTVRSDHTSVLYNGKIYSWGGIGGNYNPINTLDIYDIATNTWSTGAAGGTARQYHNSVLYNGKIYSWGGSNSSGSKLNTLDIYDIATNTWSTGAAGGTARILHSSFINNGKIYFWGGANSSNHPLNTLDIYDIATNTWSTGTAGGTARSAHTSVLYNGKVYSWGGSNDSGGNAAANQINTLDILDLGDHQNILSFYENNSAALSFQTGSVLNLDNGKLAIMGGNVGIGTATPSAKLDVNGDLNVSGNIIGKLNLSGQATISGSLNLSGIANIAGSLSVRSTSTASAAISIYNPDGSIDLQIRPGGAGLGNIFIGDDRTGSLNTTGSYNTAVGDSALFSNTTGYDNSIFGRSGYNIKDGFGNSVFGTFTGTQNSTENSIFGAYASSAIQNSNTVNSYNNAFGSYSLYRLAGGVENTAIGRNSLYKITNGSYNTALGNNSLYNTTTSGNYNLGLGYQAGQNITSGSNNIAIGFNSLLPSTTASYQLNIGNLIYGTNLNGNGNTLSTGNIGIGTATPSAKLNIVGGYGSNASLLINQTNLGDIFTASASGVTKLTIAHNGLLNATAGGLATYSKAGTISDTDFTDTALNGTLAVDSSDNRLYVRSGGVWKYIAFTAGFQIPDYEANGLSEGDFLMPYVEKKMADGAIHGLYTKFSEVKNQLFNEEITQIASLSAQINSLENKFNTTSGLYSNGLDDATVSGAITLNSTATFNGNSVFNKIADFFDTVFFHNTVFFSGKVTFDQDTAGQAIISAGTKQVDVSFVTDFMEPPVVTISSVISGNANENLSTEMAHAAVTNVTNHSFSIILPGKASQDLIYNWMAIAVLNKTTTQSAIPTIIISENSTNSATQNQ